MSSMNEDWENIVAVARHEVSATIKSLPSPLRICAEDLPVCCEHRPDDGMTEDGVEHDTLGLFVGSEYSDGEFETPPAQIILFLDNIMEAVAGDEAEFRREVRVTLMHELGHYLGLTEDALEARGIA